MHAIGRTVLRTRNFATHATVQGFNGAIGNTPLVSSAFLPSIFQGYNDDLCRAPQIYLKGLSEKTGSQIFGKAEFQNPGGSVKDRAALWLVRDAEEKGLYVVILVLGLFVNSVMIF